MTNENTKTLPVNKIRVGAVQAAIWQNSGESGPFYNVTFELSYRDANGEWRNGAKSYGQRELIHLVKAALLADSEIVKLRSAERAAEDDAADECAA